MPAASPRSPRRRRPATRRAPRAAGPRRHVQRLAAAADGRQQRVRRAAAEDEARHAGRLLQRLQQRVGTDAVHALGGVDHHHLQAAARRRRLGEVHGRPHRLHLYLLARLGLGRLGARLLEAPAEAFLQGLGQQHQQVGVRARLHQPARHASPARPRRRLGALAQPRLRQRERQLELADPCRAVHQQRVRLLRAQRVGQWRGEPGQRQLLVGAYHARLLTAASTWAHTCSRVPLASIGEKR
jgi:hypothetical protein